MALMMYSEEGHQLCANCQREYMRHYGDKLLCDPDLSKDEPRWFPAKIANALIREAEDTHETK